MKKHIGRQFCFCAGLSLSFLLGACVFSLCKATEPKSINGNPGNEGKTSEREVSRETNSRAVVDWPQWGGAASRCGVSDAKNLPSEWTIGEFDSDSGKWESKDADNVRWVAKLGSTTYGTPAVAEGRVYCATNNGGNWLKHYARGTDLGCLLCFRQKDGQFLWQLSREKLKAGNSQDWGEQGICSSPLVEKDKAWIVTNRGEVVCVKTNSIGEEAEILWTFDMIKELGVVPHNMTSGSATSAGDLLFVNTSNGADEKHTEVIKPEAPSFIALDKNSGKLVWADNSPGNNILDGQWSSPAYAVLGGVPQVIFPGGDGWVYSFRADSTDSKNKQPSPPAPLLKGVGSKFPKPELLWKFDCNPKESVWKDSASSDRCNLIATPVISEEKVYIAVGQDPEAGNGPGRLWCIDPTKHGDVSPELVVDRDGKPVAPKRNWACDKSAGETTRPNPNSAAVWCYTGEDINRDGKVDFKEAMHRTLGMAAIGDDLLVIADMAGVVHCLDLRTGKPHWTHDMMASVWGSPCIADGKIFVGNADGDVVVFAFSKKPDVLATNSVGDAVYTTPVAVGDTLYISTREHLIAVGKN